MFCAIDWEGEAKQRYATMTFQLYIHVRIDQQVACVPWPNYRKRSHAKSVLALPSIRLHVDDSELHLVPTSAELCCYIFMVFVC